MEAWYSLRIREKTFCQNAEDGQLAFVDRDDPVRTSGAVIASSVHIGVSAGAATLTLKDLLSDPVSLVHIAAHRTLLGRICGIGLSDRDTELLGEGVQLLLHEGLAEPGDQPVHPPGEVRVPEVQSFDHDLRGPMY